MQLAVLILALLFADAAHALSCKDDKTGNTLIPGNEPVVDFPADVPNGNYAHAGGNVWNSFPSFPANVYLDAITESGSSEVCWWQGHVDGPMGIAQDAATYYECTCEHYVGTANCADPDSPTEQAPPLCLPYHRTSARAPTNTSGSITYERITARDFGDGISLPDALPLGTDVTVRGSYFDYIHDDVLEDDHCSVDWVIDDVYVKRAFMFLATDRAGEPTCGSGTARTATISNSLIRLYRFTNAYKQKDGHGGLFKPDAGTNPTKVLVNNKILLGPISKNQSIYPPRSEVTACIGNVVLWDGIEDDYLDMLASKSNEANRDALNDAFPGCITEVKRLSTETSAQFLARALPELGNKSWNTVTSEWYSAHFPSCGLGFELVFLAPLFARLTWRRRAGDVAGRAGSRR